MDPLDDLTRALAALDAAAARRAIRAVPPDRHDDALAVLAHQAAEASPIATELLLEHLDERGVVRRFVRSLLLDESSVDDVCQDVLISVATSIGSYRGASSVTTWLHRIVQRRVVDHLRRQRATTTLAEDDEPPSRRMSTLIATRETVRGALAALPERYRAPVTLRDVEGVPYAEIAERLGRPVGTVKAQVARGRALVAAAMGDEP